ncbi:MAG: class A beta-lactamase-related serine hydrolase [Oscillospiraceae bacterium]|nr:class A beta-lactamase-related serine hydrolase [Oscillospiraceae bacterium]
MKKLTIFFLTLFIFTACGSSGGELRINDEKLTVLDSPTIEAVLDAHSAQAEEEEVIPRPEPPNFVEIAKTHLNESHGKVYVGMADLTYLDAYRHIDTGVFHPASTIKSFVMEYALLQIHAGNAELDELFEGYTLLYYLEQMIQVSCNESTGALIARFGRADIQSWLDVNYPSTELNSDWRNYHHNGKYNEITVEDTISFLEKLWERRFEEPYRQMLGIMYGTTWSREKIPTPFEGLENVRVASKSGSYVDGDETADHDMAIVVSYYSTGEIEFVYALTFYSFSPYNEASYSNARSAMIAMSREIYEQVSLFYAGVE